MASAKASNAPVTSAPTTLQRDLDAIAKNPADFNAVASYGAPPVDALGKLATRLLQTQGRFNTTVNELAATQQNLLDEIEALPPGALLGTRPASLKETFDAMAHTLVAVEAAKKEGEAIGRERVQIAQDLRRYLDAIPAVQEEYRRKHIPAATTDADKLLLEKRLVDFTDRKTIIEAVRASSTFCGLQVKQMLEVMDSSIESIRPMLADMKDLYKSAKLDFEEKESARRLAAVIEDFSQGTTAPVTVKKPLQFRPKP